MAAEDRLAEPFEPHLKESAMQEGIKGGVYLQGVFQASRCCLHGHRERECVCVSVCVCVRVCVSVCICVCLYVMSLPARPSCAFTRDAGKTPTKDTCGCEDRT